MSTFLNSVFYFDYFVVSTIFYIFVTNNQYIIRNMKKQDIKANMLADNFTLSDSNPTSIATSIAERMKRNRLELNLTQNALASRSGVSFASLRRFENTGEVSLKSLILIAIALDSTEGFSSLFSTKKYKTIDDVMALNDVQTKKRGRIN